MFVVLCCGPPPSLRCSSPLSPRFAYIEFQEKESVDNALLLNDSKFKERELKVKLKATT